MHICFHLLFCSMHHESNSIPSMFRNDEVKSTTKGSTVNVFNWIGAKVCNSIRKMMLNKRIWCQRGNTRRNSSPTLYAFCIQLLFYVQFSQNGVQLLYMTVTTVTWTRWEQGTADCCWYVQHFLNENKKKKDLSSAALKCQLTK